VKTVGVKNWGSDVIPWKWITSSYIAPGTIAIDVPNYLTRRLVVMHSKKKEDGKLPMSHVGLFLSLVKATLGSHILPVFIFDGPPESRKRSPNPALVEKATSLYRTFQQEGDPFNEEISDELWSSRALRAYFATEHLRDLGSMVGVPTITAPSEAEMFAAVLCRDDAAKTVVSNDSDALLFGSPHVTKQMQLSSGQILCVTSSDFENHLGLDIELIRDLAIISGCDFHKEGVKGIGVRRGVVLLQRYGGLVGLLKAQGYSSSERREFIEAREVFDEASYLSAKKIKLCLNPPLASKLMRALGTLMSSEQAESLANRITSLWRGFSNRQSTLEQWF
jgi:flap endonuclease-1